MSLTDLQRRLSGRISSTELWRVLSAWQSTGQAEVFSPKGQKRRYVSLF
jgi:hypothetical protein